MSGENSNRLFPNFDASIPRHWQKLYPQTASNRTFLKSPPLSHGSRHSRPAKADQTGEKGDVTTLRAKLTTMVESLAMRRRQFQHAADGEYMP
jgi:hypothetical protein